MNNAPEAPAFRRGWSHQMLDADLVKGGQEVADRLTDGWNVLTF